MQPNNPLTDLNIRSVLVCEVYARLKRWVFNLDLNWLGEKYEQTMQCLQAISPKQF